MTVTSPLREFREHHGLGVQQFAREVGCTPLAITRAEQAVFVSVPPAILKAILAYEPFATSSGFVLSDPESVAEAYNAYQREQRRRSFGLLTPRLPDYDPAISPLVHWRSTSGLDSQIGFCKLFCVHPSPVAQLELGHQRKLPGQLLDALAQSGYDENVIHELQSRQVLFTQRKK